MPIRCKSFSAAVALAMLATSAAATDHLRFYVTGGVVNNANAMILYEGSLSSLQTEPVGSIGLRSIRALDVDAQGRLWAAGDSAFAAQLSRANGAANPVYASTIAFGMAVGPDDIARTMQPTSGFATFPIASIDLATGQPIATVGDLGDITGGWDFTSDGRLIAERNGRLFQVNLDDGSATPESPFLANFIRGFSIVNDRAFYLIDRPRGEPATIYEYDFDTKASTLVGELSGAHDVLSGTISLDGLAVFTATCNSADLAPPFGLLNLEDTNAFIASFLASEPPADLAPPADIYDLDDVDAFIASFLAGCP